jgi:flavin reductase (DIM6/NTAB) family NADH-FMN oxidoreductase RutF
MASANPFDLFAVIDPPIWLVTAASGDRRAGLIATFINQASITPRYPRVVVGIARQHHTWELVEGSRCFTLHLLGPEQLELVWRFGLHTGKERDKFAGIPFVTTPLGNPRLTDALGWLDCRVETSLDTGDRSIYLAEVTEGGVEKAGPFLTLKRVLQQATPEQLQELKRQMDRDQAVDAAAIERWRAGLKGSV